jgi:hypothetical protein
MEVTMKLRSMAVLLAGAALMVVAPGCGARESGTHGDAAFSSEAHSPYEQPTGTGTDLTTVGPPGTATTTDMPRGVEQTPERGAGVTAPTMEGVEPPPPQQPAP